MSIELTTNVKEGQYKYKSPAGRAGTLNDIPTLSVEERGSGSHHVTIINMVSAPMAALGSGTTHAIGLLLYTFPSVTHRCNTARIDIPAGSVFTGHTAAGDIGLGSTIATGTNAALSDVGATAEDYFTGTAFTITSGLSVAFDTTLDSAVIFADDGTKTLHLNLAGGTTWDSTAFTPLITGKVVIDWSELGGA